MGLKDFYNEWNVERIRKSTEVDRKVYELGIYDAGDIEQIRDEIEKQFAHKATNERIRKDKGVVESYTKRDRGLRAEIFIYQPHDHYATQEDVNRAIEKVGNKANVFTQKTKKAQEFISAYLSKGYYGYLSLRKLIGHPLEHPVLRTWYANELYKIPALVNPGGKITLSEGNFYISANDSPILLNKSNVALVGAGRGTKVCLTAGSLISNLVEASDVSGLLIRDMLLDGTTGAADAGSCTRQNCICFKQNVFDSFMSNIWAENAVRHSFCIDNGSQRNIISETISKNIAQGKDYMEAIVVYAGSDDNIIHHNLVLNTQGWGISLGSTTGTISSHNLITNNWVVDTEKYDGIGTDGGNYNIFVNNHVKNAGRDGMGIAASYNDIVANNIILEASQDATNTHSDINVYYGTGSYNLIQGNVCRAGSLANKPKYGIVVASGQVGIFVLNNDIRDDGFATNTLNDAGTSSIIKNNRGYNPVGISSIAVGASEFTHSAGASPETIYIHGGTVSLIKKGTTTIFTDTGHSVELEPHELCKVTWSVQPTMYKDVH